MSSQLLWYTTRGAGAVSLVLLSAVVILGLLARLRFESRGWPRFLSAAVHGDLALMTLVFLVLHIVTAVVDPFTHLGLAAPGAVRLVLPHAVARTRSDRL